MYTLNTVLFVSKASSTLEKRIHTYPCILHIILACIEYSCMSYVFMLQNLSIGNHHPLLILNKRYYVKVLIFFVCLTLL